MRHGQILPWFMVPVPELNSGRLRVHGVRYRIIPAFDAAESLPSVPFGLNH
jgi:hypothetical protein